MRQDPIFFTDRTTIINAIVADAVDDGTVVVYCELEELTIDLVHREFGDEFRRT